MYTVKITFDALRCNPPYFSQEKTTFQSLDEAKEYGHNRAKRFDLIEIYFGNIILMADMHSNFKYYEKSNPTQQKDKTMTETMTFKEWLETKTVLEFCYLIEEQHPFSTFKVVHWWDSENDKFVLDIENDLCQCMEIEISFTDLTVVVNAKECSFVDFNRILSTCQQNAHDRETVCMYPNDWAGDTTSKFDGLISVQKRLEWKLPIQRRNIVQNVDYLTQFNRWVVIHAETLQLLERIEKMKRDLF
jgi:hypothetical protein